MKLQKIGKLDCVHIQGKDGGPLVVMFHGYGANCHDLSGLANEINLTDATWIFPNGIIDVPIGPGWMGKAWFPIDIEALNLAMQAGGHRDMRNIRPPGIDKAINQVTELFKWIDFSSHSKVFIGGFSQGAMLSAEFLFSSTLDFSGLIFLSGTIIDENSWKEKLQTRKPLPFFQSHGNQDPVLNFKVAQRFETLLRDHKWNGHLSGFSGGHEIPLNIIKELERFLNSK